MSGCADMGDEALAEDVVHVALSMNPMKGRWILEWAFKHFRGKELVLVHIHKPPKLIPMKMGGKFPIYMASPEEAEVYIEEKREEMNTLMDMYIRFCTAHKVSVRKLVLETDDVFSGIVYLVGQHQIKKLVLGLKSTEDQPVLKEGLLSCQVWLVYNGKCVFTRHSMLDKMSIKFTGDEQGGSLTPSANIAKEISSSRSSIETSTSRNSNEASSPESFRQTSETCREDAAEETKGSSNKEDCPEAEDFRELLMRLAEVVNFIRQQRLNLARQMLVLKQEFIEFSLPELEEATNKYISKHKKGLKRR